jgi:hypothetical protein
MNNFEDNYYEEPGATAPGYTTPRVLRGGIHDVVFTSCLGCFQ